MEGLCTVIILPVTDEFLNKLTLKQKLFLDQTTPRAFGGLYVCLCIAWGWDCVCDQWSHGTACDNLVCLELCVCFMSSD